MLRYECMKIFSKKINKVALGFLLISLVLLSYWSMEDVKYLQRDGITQDKGIKAAEQLTQEKDRWTGYLTKHKLVEMLEENNLLNRTEEALSNDYIMNDQVFSKKQSYSDIHDMLAQGAVPYNEYDYFRMDNMSKHEIASIYEYRISMFEEYLDNNMLFTIEEKNYLIDNYKSLETPFYYEPFEGWKSLLDTQYMSTFITIIILVSAFFVAGIFSDEFVLKADAIFFSTKLGRSRAVVSKITTGMVVITLTYWISVLLYASIQLTFLGFKGAHNPIQLYVWDSIYNITNVEYFWFTTLAGYVACIFILTLSMLVSAISRSSLFTITIPFILTCVTPFLSRITILKNISTYLPDTLVRLNSSIDVPNLIPIATHVIRTSDAIIFVYAVLSIVMIPIIYMVYRKSEIL